MAERKPSVHVVPRGNDWIVKRAGSDRASVVTPTQKEAVEAGRRIAQRDKTELLIHGENGRIRSKDSYGNDTNPPKDREHESGRESSLMPEQSGVIASRVIVDPAVHHGAPVMAGTRVPVSLVVGSLAGKMSAEDVMREYDLSREDINAALAYAADLVARTTVIPLAAA